MFSLAINHQQRSHSVGSFPTRGNLASVEKSYRSAFPTITETPRPGRGSQGFSRPLWR
jgi:hypothetical protein